MNEPVEIIDNDSTALIILKAVLRGIGWLFKIIFIFGVTLLMGTVLSLAITGMVFGIIGLLISVGMWIGTGQIFYYWAPWMTRVFALINVVGIIIGVATCIKLFTPASNMDVWSNNTFFEEDEE